MSDGSRTGGCIGLVMFFGFSALILGCFGVCFVPTFGLIALAMVDSATATLQSAKITGHRWERSVEVEKLVRDHDEDWCDDVPKDGHITEKWYERKSKYRKGYRCEYWVLEWDRVDTKKKTGKGFKPKPSWPKVGDDGCKREGCQRPGDKDADYYVDFRVGGSDKDCNFDDEAKWRGFKVGSTHKVKVGGIIGTVNCSSLK